MLPAVLRHGIGMYDLSYSGSRWRNQLAECSWDGFFNMLGAYMSTSGLARSFRWAAFRIEKLGLAIRSVVAIFLTVRTGRQSDHGFECATEGINRLESGTLGNVFHGDLRNIEQSLSPAEPQTAQMPPEAESIHRAKLSPEMAFGKADRLRDLFQAQRLIQAGHDVTVDLDQQFGISRGIDRVGSLPFGNREAAQKQVQVCSKKMAAFFGLPAKNNFAEEDEFYLPQNDGRVMKRLELLGGGDVELNEEPEQTILRHLSVGVELKRENQKRFTGLQKNIFVIDADPTRSGECDEQDTVVVLEDVMFRNEISAGEADRIVRVNARSNIKPFEKVAWLGGVFSQIFEFSQGEKIVFHRKC